MSILRGEDVVLGVGAEESAARGVAVDPQMWIPGRTPTGVAPVLEKVPLRETRGSKVASFASEITQKRAEGDLEFNVRSESIGYILRSLFGKCTSTPAGDVFSHVFEILPNNPQHPTLTFGLSQPGLQDYEYTNGMPTKLKLDISPDDLVRATVSIVAAKETELAGSPYTVVFSNADYHFRHQDVTIKLAPTAGELDSATPIKLKTFSLEIPNGGRVDQNISELNPGDVLATTFEITGSFELDLQDTDLHDVYDGGEYQALEITIARSDVEIGSGVGPSLVITLPKISIAGWTPNRPIDDVTREQINFMAHWDIDSEEAIEATLVSATENYLAASES